MENHLIIVPSDTQDHQEMALIDRYLAGLSKDKISYNKGQRKITVHSLNMQFFFRKNTHSLGIFLKGREFKTTRIINCCVSNQVMHDLYIRSKEIKIERLSF